MAIARRCLMFSDMRKEKLQIHEINLNSCFNLSEQINHKSINKLK